MAKNFVAGASHPGQMEREGVIKPFAKPSDIKWNFGKFLIDRDGNVITRYSPAYKPENLENDIINAVSK